jgi:hypothetical protein
VTGGQIQVTNAYDVPAGAADAFFEQVYLTTEHVK